MNMIRYDKTPIARVLETIRAEAARYGVAIAGTELVGPVPLATLEEVRTLLPPASRVFNRTDY